MENTPRAISLVSPHTKGRRREVDRFLSFILQERGILDDACLLETFRGDLRNSLTVNGICLLIMAPLVIQGLNSVRQARIDTMNALLAQIIAARTQKLRTTRCTDSSCLPPLESSLTLPASGLSPSAIGELSYSSLLYMCGFICCIFNSLYVLSMQECLKRISRRTKHEDHSLRDEDRDVSLAVNFRLIPNACLQLSVSLFLAGLATSSLEIGAFTFAPALLLAGYIIYTFTAIRPVFDSEAPFKDYLVPTFWWLLRRTYLTGRYCNL